MPSRRRTLHALAGLGTISLAGCVSGEPEESERTDEADRDDSMPFSSTPPVSRSLGSTSESPWWYEVDPAAPGAVYLITGQDKLPDEVQWGFPEEIDDVRPFLDDTDFEESVVLLLSAVAPADSDAEIDIDSMSKADERLEGEATITRDQATDLVSTEFVWQIVRYPYSLITPTTVTFSMTDGWGNTAEISAPTTRALDPDELPGYIRPTGEPPAVPPSLDCPQPGYERLDQMRAEDTIELGGQHGVTALRADRQSYEYGDTARITFQNISDAGQSVGTTYKSTLQLQTEDGWEDVRVSANDERVAWTDEGIGYPPGASHEWELELTEEGIAALGAMIDSFEVCPTLQTGRYRFLFWGGNAAVEFDLIG